MYLQYRKASVNSYLTMLQRSVLITYGIISEFSHRNSLPCDR